MKIIRLITEGSVLRQMLEQIQLWEQKLSRDPPRSETLGVVSDLFDNVWAYYDENCTPLHSA